MPRKNREFQQWFSREKLLPFLAVFAVFLVVFVGAIFSIRWFLYKNPFFEIKEVSTPIVELPKSQVYNLINRNIFSLDLEKLYSQIRQEYPYAKKIKIRKYLPNKLEIIITRRIPILIIRKNRKIYPVDELGMVLPATKNLPSSKILEVIIENKKSVKPGKFLKDEGLFLAIDLIKALRETRLMDVFDFTLIDAREPYELRLYMKDDIVWKMRTQKYKDKLIMFKKRLMENYLKNLKTLKKGSYLLFSDDGTVTASI